MKRDFDRFRPPDDLRFQELLAAAVQGQVRIYGVVLATAKLRLRRFDDKFRPENSPEGEEALRSVMQAWNEGRPIQPWLYADSGEYVVADDYFWLAAVERGKPPTVAVQILGEPLLEGLVQKVGPLPVAQVEQLLGLKA